MIKIHITLFFVVFFYIGSASGQVNRIRFNSDTAQKAFEINAKNKLINFAKKQSDSILEFLSGQSVTCPMILVDSCFERNSGSSWYWPFVTDTALKYYVVKNIIDSDTNIIRELQKTYFKRHFNCPQPIYGCGFTKAVEEVYLYNKTSYFELINIFLINHN